MLGCSVSRTSSSANSSSVQRARPAGGPEQAVATSKASSLPDSLRPAPGRGSSPSAASRLPSTKRIHGRTTDPHADGNVLVGGAGVGRQQDLRPLKLAYGCLPAL